MMSRQRVCLLLLLAIGVGSRFVLAHEIPNNPLTGKPLSRENVAEYAEECIVEDCDQNELNEIFAEDFTEASESQAAVQPAIKGL